MSEKPIAVFHFRPRTVWKLFYKFSRYVMESMWVVFAASGILSTKYPEWAAVIFSSGGLLLAMLIVIVVRQRMGLSTVLIYEDRCEIVHQKRVEHEFQWINVQRVTREELDVNDSYGPQLNLVVELNNGKDIAIPFELDNFKSMKEMQRLTKELKNRGLNPPDVGFIKYY